MAWTLTVTRSHPMDGGAGTTSGLGLPSFVVMWTLMMAAMMLPAIAPVATLYSRTVRSSRALRLAAFTLGYLVVWVVAGVPAFLLARACTS